MQHNEPVVVSRLHYHQRSRQVDVSFSNGDSAGFSAEFLRVFSPSAEVRGHGKPKLVTNKKQVAISKLLPVGHYAIKLVFDDGHQTGLYSWAYLAKLAAEQDELWAECGYDANGIVKTVKTMLHMDQTTQRASGSVGS